MKSFCYTIKEPMGLHARPAGVLVKKSKEYKSTIKIKKGEKEVFANKLMAVMGLCVKMGEEVIVSIEGEDEEQVFCEVEQFFQDNF